MSPTSILEHKWDFTPPSYHPLKGEVHPDIKLDSLPYFSHISTSIQAQLHKFGQEGLNLPQWSLTGGYLIKSALDYHKKKEIMGDQWSPIRHCLLYSASQKKTKPRSIDVLS